MLSTPPAQWIERIGCRNDFAEQESPIWRRTSTIVTSGLDLPVTKNYQVANQHTIDKPPHSEFVVACCLRGRCMAEAPAVYEVDFLSFGILIVLGNPATLLHIHYAVLHIAGPGAPQIPDAHEHAVSVDRHISQHSVWTPMARSVVLLNAICCAVF
jgi:hypothetical protein